MSEEQGKYKAERFECFFCDVELIFNQEKGFYWCPDCGGEWWPGPKKYGENTIWRDEQRYKKRLSKQGGGSKTAGRKQDKKKIKKERPWLYDT